MFTYIIKLYTDKLPLDWDYFSKAVVTAHTEEEAREMVNEAHQRGNETHYDLEIIKTYYMSYATMEEKFKKNGLDLTRQMYNDLIPRKWGEYVDDNEIWKNQEFTKIIEIGTSHLTEPEVHLSSFHAG